MICAPAIAQTTDTRPVLWGDLRYGMTKDEVKAKVGGNDIELSSLCKAVAGPYYRDGKLYRFTLRETTPYDATCDSQLIDGLTQRYGQPVGSEDYLAGKQTKRRRVWQSGKLQIRFDEGQLFWTLQYSLLDDAPEPIANKL
jgi:hypothetical protein